MAVFGWSCAEYRLIWGDEMEVSCRLEVRVLSEA